MLSRGISSADGIGPAIQIVGNVLQGDRGCFRHPESVLAVSELGDWSVNIVVRPRCRREDYGALRFDFMRTLRERLEEAGQGTHDRFPLQVSDRPAARGSR